MKIYGRMLCSRCGKSYYGRFKIDNEGNVSCVNCDNPDILSDELDIKYMWNSEVLRKTLIHMMEYDMKYIYTYVAEKGERVAEVFIKQKEGAGNKVELDLEKIYFMGNDLSIVKDAQNYAIRAIKYNKMNENGEHLEKANYFINMYLVLRERKLTEEEKINYINEMKRNNYWLPDR